VTSAEVIGAWERLGVLRATPDTDLR
jgi:hypothetical protein